MIKQIIKDTGIIKQKQELIPNYIKNYYTKNEIDDKGYITEIPSEYVTSDELESKGYLTGIPSEYITETELESKGYLTEHQSLADYALKSELPDTSNFATIDQIPDTSKLATKEQLEDITDNVYTKTEIDSKFGNIDAILDNINGEIV